MTAPSRRRRPLTEQGAVAYLTSTASDNGLQHRSRSRSLYFAYPDVVRERQRRVDADRERNHLELRLEAIELELAELRATVAELLTAAASR